MKTIAIDGVEFLLDNRAGRERAKSEVNKFVLVKTQELIDYYERMKTRAPRTIMEVGVFEGGSMVYFDKLLRPEKIVGVDIKREPIPALDRYIEDHPYMKMYYARSQDKIGTVMAARENFPSGIDLVVDDASHLYEQSKATFEMLFPLVTVGGEYIIEDWAWAHRPNYQANHATWFDRPALTTLVFELTILSSVCPAIDSIYVRNGFASVRRGRGALPKDMFNLAPYLRGRPAPIV